MQQWGKVRTRKHGEHEEMVKEKSSERWRCQEAGAGGQAVSLQGSHFQAEGDCQTIS